MIFNLLNLYAICWLFIIQYLEDLSKVKVYGSRRINEFGDLFMQFRISLNLISVLMWTYLKRAEHSCVKKTTSCLLYCGLYLPSAVLFDMLHTTLTCVSIPFKAQLSPVKVWVQLMLPAGSRDTLWSWTWLSLKCPKMSPPRHDSHWPDMITMWPLHWQRSQSKVYFLCATSGKISTNEVVFPVLIDPTCDSCVQWTFRPHVSCILTLLTGAMIDKMDSRCCMSKTWPSDTDGVQAQMVILSGK